MADSIDKLIGIYHFISDRAPKNVPTVRPRPRVVNRWCQNGQPIVSKVTPVEDIRQSIETGMSLLGNLEQGISSGDSVFVKPNFNSWDPYPGSTDLVFLGCVVELLLEAGAKVVIGDCSGGIWRPTGKVFQKLGVFELARRLNVELIAFEDRPDDWVRVEINGDYLKVVTMPRSAYEADKLIYLPCLKTHRQARFTGALKLAVGFMHPGERRGLHAHNLEQKIAEISLCWQPDLIITDGRKAFVTGGPDKGELVEPKIILTSGDLIASDVEAMKILLTYDARNSLGLDPWESPQIITALKHHLGSGKNNYVVTE